MNKLEIFNLHVGASRYVEISGEGFHYAILAQGKETSTQTIERQIRECRQRAALNNDRADKLENILKSTEPTKTKSK